MQKENLIKSVKTNLLRTKDHNQKEKILEAIKVIDRKYFIPDKSLAYLDNAIPIGHGQTISQPTTVARMIQYARLRSGHDVLEIGAGSGWNASITGFIAYPGRLLSLDIVPELIDNAKHNLMQLKENVDEDSRKRLEKISFKHKNIFKDSKNIKEKFDRIIITAGIESQQEEIVKKLAQNALKDNGILITPYIKGPLLLMKKTGEKIRNEYTDEEYVFVPLIG